MPSSSRSSSRGSIRTFESEPIQSGIAARANALGRQEAVAEVGLGRGAAQIVAPDEARRSSSAPSAWVACTTVVLRLAAGAGEQLDRSAAVLGEALLDLLRLLVGVDVQREVVSAA